MLEVLEVLPVLLSLGDPQLLLVTRTVQSFVEVDKQRSGDNVADDNPLEPPVGMIIVHLPGEVRHLVNQGVWVLHWPGGNLGCHCAGFM